MSTCNGGKDVQLEALVHPAMITHLNPTRVAVIGGKHHQTSATLGEILKHASVKDAVILQRGGVEEHEDDAVDERVSTLEMKGQECSLGDHEQFDVIIDPNPFQVVTGFSSSFNCLNDGGVVSVSSMIHDIAHDLHDVHVLTHSIFLPTCQIVTGHYSACLEHRHFNHSERSIAWHRETAGLGKRH